jgi:hypothetical protein
MPNYPLYCLDEHGRILHPHDFEAADDVAALVVAEERDHRHLDCEIWERARKVAVLPARVEAIG